MAVSISEVKERVRLRDYAESVLDSVHGGFVCPICGSGTGPKGTPAFSIKGEMWKCFACNNHGDVLDLAGAVLNTDDKSRQIEAVASWAGIADTERAARPQDRAQAPTAGDAELDLAKDYDERQKAEREAEERYVEEAHGEFASYPEAVSYWCGRGFTAKEADMFGIGYDPRSRRLVLPWPYNRYYHIDRSIVCDRPKYTKPSAVRVGPQPSVFFPPALEEPAFFVVEGVLDALAVMACGYSAEALAGVGFSKLVTSLAEERYRGVVVIALDNDAAGKKSAADLASALDRSGIAHVMADPYPMGCKDAAEVLGKDRDALSDWISGNYSVAMAESERVKEAAYTDAMARLHVYSSYETLSRIVCGAAARPSVPTGIKALDRALHGGLHPGLTVLGAGSSQGKTTLLVQIADHIAASKRPVLFVSIEQSCEELIVKSLCRIAHASSGLCLFGQSDVLDSTARESWGVDSDKAAALSSAAEEYRSTIAPWLLYMGADGRPSVSDIRAAADRIAERCRVAPIVFVDYVQLLKPHDDRATDKQILDHSVTALRQLARDLYTPVVVVSSLNRASYFSAVGMDSFKESGSVEYSADFALGLQPAGLADAIKNRAKGVRPEDAAEQFIEDNKRQTVPMREVVVIKLRGYRLPLDPVRLRFNGAAQLFEDAAMA